MTPQTIDRLAQSFTVTDGCWPWMANRIPTGYGKFWADGRYSVAHRVVFEVFCGPIPEGLSLDHTCHNADPSCAGGPTCLHRRCVNPAHLEPVTHRVNVLRGAAPSARHARATHCPQGHAYAGDNLIQREGHRGCRACQNERGRDSHRRNSAAKRIEQAEWAADLERRRWAKNSHSPTPRGRPIPGALIECPVCHDWIGYWPDKLNPYKAYIMSHGPKNARCEGRMVG